MERHSTKPKTAAEPANGDDYSIGIEVPPNILKELTPVGVSAPDKRTHGSGEEQSDPAEPDEHELNLRSAAELGAVTETEVRSAYERKALQIERLIESFPYLKDCVENWDLEGLPTDALRKRFVQEILGERSEEAQQLINRLLVQNPMVSDALLELPIELTLESSTNNNLVELLSLAYTYCKLVDYDTVLAQDLVRINPDTQFTPMGRQEGLRVFYQSMANEDSSPLRNLIEKQIAGENSTVNSACLKGVLGPYFELQSGQSEETLLDRVGHFLRDPFFRSEKQLRELSVTPLRRKDTAFIRELAEETAASTFIDPARDTSNEGRTSLETGVTADTNLQGFKKLDDGVIELTLPVGTTIQEVGQILNAAAKEKKMKYPVFYEGDESFWAKNEADSELRTKPGQTYQFKISTDSVSKARAKQIKQYGEEGAPLGAIAIAEACERLNTENQGTLFKNANGGVWVRGSAPGMALFSHVSVGVLVYDCRDDVGYDIVAFAPVVPSRN